MCYLNLPNESLMNMFIETESTYTDFVKSNFWDNTWKTKTNTKSTKN